jgi:hypothetical protein
LTTVRFDHPAQQIVLQDYIDAVTDAERRVDRVTRQISEHLPGWSMAPVATAIQAMRGVALINASPTPGDRKALRAWPGLMAGAEAVSHHDKQSTGALLARFLGLGCFDDRSVEPGFPHFQVVFTDEPSVPSVYPAVLVLQRERSVHN